MSKQKQQTDQPHRLAVALQGGGVHGAWSWGVLDRLLESEAIEIAALTGSGAGALNAACLVYGLQAHGREGARELLNQLWYRIAVYGRNSMLRPSWLDYLINPDNLDYSPAYWFFKQLTHIYSPYEYNPLDINPLRELLLELIDFEVLQKTDKVQLFSCAANVKTHHLRVFRTEETTIDTVLAAACVPQITQAVEIDGEHYWEGGSLGNPPIRPLVAGTDLQDLLMVLVTPVAIDHVPKTAVEIEDRLRELQGLSALEAELRILELQNELADAGQTMGGEFRRINLHALSAQADLKHVNNSSRYNTSWSFIKDMRDRGRQHADQWLEAHAARIGTESTTSVERLFTPGILTAN